VDYVSKFFTGAIVLAISELHALCGDVKSYSDAAGDIA
jgi:hypothetical protein